MAIFLSNRKLESEISRRSSEACEEIISEMGAELHDDLIQKLSVFRFYLDRIDKASNNPDEISALSIKMRTEFEQIIRVVRNISRRLLPVKMEGDTLDRTLEMLCQNMEHPGAGHIHFSSIGPSQSLPPNIERHLFRVVQELIHNAFKHSSAWHIWVRLQWTVETLVVEVEDDGTGFSKIPEYIKRLRKKNNTLKLRSCIIGARLQYTQGEKGLLAKLRINIPA